ncbi:MAG: alpha-galactosidase, partial [Micropruina sp.]|nr:alpha-galactosidase [Micropruina sp.]
FGLWFEPEMINIDPTWPGAHPEWVMATVHRLPVESRDTNRWQINLGIPELRLHQGRDLSRSRPSMRSAILADHNRRPDRRRHQAWAGRPGVYMSKRWPTTGCLMRSRPPTWVS